MKHAEDPKPDESTIYPLHREDADPDFEDKYYAVRLDSHESFQNTPEDRIAAPNPFACRVRQWKFGDADAPKLRFLLIAGIAHSCNFFNPLVKCMSLDETFAGYRVEVYALDVPGHGASHCPPNIKFGMLRLEDYVDVIKQVIDRLRTDDNVDVIDYVVAHSMGGMLAMLLEQSLAASYTPTTLNALYGTKGIILFASALPEQVDWSLGEGRISEYGVPANILRALLPFVTFSPRYALHGRISNEDFVKQFFGMVESGRERDRIQPVTIVPGAPIGDEVSVMNSGESYIALSELAGLDLESGGILKRPDIKEGLFSNYTLGVAGYTKDFLFRPEEEQALLEHLSLNRRRIYRTVDHQYAVHDDPYSFPCASFRFLADVVTLSNP